MEKYLTSRNSIQFKFPFLPSARWPFFRLSPGQDLATILKTDTHYGQVQMETSSEQKVALGGYKSLITRTHDLYHPARHTAKPQYSTLHTSSPISTDLPPITTDTTCTCLCLAINLSVYVHTCTKRTIESPSLVAAVKGHGMAGLCPPP